MKLNKIISMGLAFFICLSMTSISAFASQDSSRIPIEFGSREYYKTDLTLEKGKQYVIPEHGIFRVEEGATLYLDGELQVLGTLKNYGTIVVRDSVPATGKREATQEDTRGYLSISGTMLNEGTVKVKNASIQVKAGATLTNKGNVELKNTIEGLTPLWNLSRSNGGQYLGGVIENTKKGTISLMSTGIGLRNEKGATIQNNGVIQGIKGSQIKGSLVGNSLETVEGSTK